MLEAHYTNAFPDFEPEDIATWVLGAIVQALDAHPDFVGRAASMVNLSVGIRVLRVPSP